MRWTAAVESLCGALDGPPPPASAAADGLALTLDAGGRWALTTSDGQATQLAGAPDGQPGPIARALTALAPALAAPIPAAMGGDPRDAWARATHAALTRGEVSFERAVVAPFKRHDLTRSQVRALLHIGLIEVGGLYTALARRWRVEAAEYQRALDFLRRANAALDYRPYRRGDPPLPPEG